MTDVVVIPVGVQSVRVSEIVVNSGRRRLGDVADLANSIRLLGLLNPITITTDGVLVAGYHRLEACRSLGWETIAANVVSLGALDAELAEIDENLARNDLTVLERAELLVKRKANYLARFPDSAPGVRRAAGMNEALGHNVDEIISPTFADETAVKVGVTARTIQQETRIATAIAEDVRDSIRDTEIADTKVELLALAKLEPAQQRDAVEKVLSGQAETIREAATTATDAKAHVSYNSGDNEWYTPAEYIAAAREAMGGIDLDPASSAIANKTVGATRFYTVSDNGLEQAWRGRVWLNPPYSQPLIEDFVRKIVDGYNDHEIEQACVLVNNATETQWFQWLLVASQSVCFIKGRIRFLNAGGLQGAPLQGQAILYFGERIDAFTRFFSQFGPILHV